MPLTDTAIRNAKPQDKALKLFDGGGLFLLVSPAGGKWWRLKYRFGGKEKLLSLGTYPLVSLKEARERREEAKKLLEQGVDPGEQRKATKAAVHAAVADAFENIALEWHARNKSKWTTKHAEKVLFRLQGDLFPILGNRPIREISAPEILVALRKVEERGAVETAHRVLQFCGQIFRYAIATGRAERDTAADLKGALTPFKKQHYATITDPKEIGILLRDLDSFEGNLIIRAALRMAPYVFVRPGELRRSEWTEFDLEKAEWRIPGAKMKMREQHIVPLSRQVIAILEELRPYTSQSPYLFPSMRAMTAPISDMTLLSALRRLGYDKSQMTMHGFRAMASTLLNEQGYNRDWIERQLAHGERNGVRASYNYAQYLPERRHMMQEWADYLDGLREKRRQL